MSFHNRFSRSAGLKLFLSCAFPVHFWAIVMVLKEAETLLVKRDLVYGLGFSGYLLALALLESLLLFAFIYALSFLFPKRWDEHTALVVACLLGLVVAGWSIGNQSFFLLVELQPAWFEWLMLRVGYRQRLAYGLLVALVSLSAALPLAGLPQSARGIRLAEGLIEKLILLTPLYLAMDVIGIVFMTVRNLT
jgi:hypothetical protein